MVCPHLDSKRVCLCVFIGLTDNEFLFALHLSSMRTRLLILELDVCGLASSFPPLCLSMAVINQEVYLPSRVALLVCKESLLFHRIRRENISEMTILTLLLF